MNDSILPVQAKLEIKADVTEASTILSKGTASGMSRFFNLVFGKREADVERYKIVSRVQTFREVCEVLQKSRHFLPASFSQNGSHKENSDLDLMRPMMEESAKNLMASLGVAYERIQSEPDIPEYSENENPSQTLFNRWRHEAQFISEKELQQLWGNILAQEIIKPGSISPRTLEALKNVSAVEAESFCKLCDYVIQDDCFLSEWNFKDKFGPGEKEYEIDNLDVLGELGFISGFGVMTTGMLEFNNHSEPARYQLKYGKYYLIFYGKRVERLPIGKLTTVGKDLYKISENITLEKAISFSELLFKYIEVMNDKILITQLDDSGARIQLAEVQKQD